MLKKLLTLVIILIGVLGLNAQTISGTVTTYNGVAIANHSVAIMNFDSLNPYYATTTTNTSGAFSFSSLPSSTGGYVVSTLDCQNQNHDVVISSNSGTANFTICSSNPISCSALFASYPDSNNTNIINFTDLSAGNPTSWTWNFGDGSSSTSQNPSHTYAASGTYSVTLSISSANCSDSITQSVVIGTVIPTCTAAFYYVPDSSNQSAVDFFDISTGNPTSWTWDFGDGNSSSLQNPSHTYAANGNYTVTLSTSSALCSDSTSQTVIIGNVISSCAAAFYYMPDSTNQNMIYFADASTGNPTSWLWDFGDGSSSTLQYPSHTYAANGTYNVTLSISSANCSDSTTQIVVIGTTSACQAAFTSTPDSSNTNTIFFTDASTGNINSWNWSFGDGTSSTSQNPSHTYASAGTYNVALMVYGPQNCQSIVTNSITIGSSPSNYTISGTVMEGSNLASSAIISLFNVVSNSFISSTTLNPTGTYLFSNVAAGTYKVLAMPDSNSIQSYAPTYYGDVLYWATASLVNVTSNQNLGAINLIALPSVPTGNGTISGNIGTGSKSGTDNAIVNLLDNNMDLIATTQTNTNGDYSFTDLAYNTYKIWVEIAGKVSTPITVTLDADNNTSSNNDFIETDGTVTPKPNSIENVISNSDINLYPNPVQNILNIDINVNNAGNYTFNIYSITGQLITAEQINISSGENLIKLNTNNLNSGSYILIISNDNNTSIQKLFTK